MRHQSGDPYARQRASSKRVAADANAIARRLEAERVAREANTRAAPVQMAKEWKR